MKTLEELAFELDRLGAAQKCEQLMSTYVNLHAAMRHYAYMKLWAHRDDCKLEMPWGAYEGFAGVERCYLKGLEQVRRRLHPGGGRLEDLEDEGLSSVPGTL